MNNYKMTGSLTQLGRRIGASRRQINTVTLDSECNSGIIIEFLRNSGFDVEISREQTSTYDGKVFIKVFEVEDAKHVERAECLNS